MPTLTLRPLTEADIPFIHAVYSHYVMHTTASYESDVPSQQALSSRIQTHDDAYPKLVCEQDGSPVAFVYAYRLHERQSYDWSASASIYVDPAHRRTGAGRALYRALIALLRAQGYVSLFALVTHPNPESQRFHESLGFVQQGLLERAGFKFGMPLGVAYYALSLSSIAKNPPPPRRLRALESAEVAHILIQAATR